MMMIEDQGKIKKMREATLRLPTSPGEKFNQFPPMNEVTSQLQSSILTVGDDGGGGHCSDRETKNSTVCQARNPIEIPNGVLELWKAHLRASVSPNKVDVVAQHC